MTSLEIDDQGPSTVEEESIKTSTSGRQSAIHRHQKSWILPLCVSHAAAAWGERSWEFGAGLLLLHLSSNNNNNNNIADGNDNYGEESNSSNGQELRLTALLVFLECGACSLLGPRIGHIVDQAPLLSAALGTLSLQNLGIGIAAGSLIWALQQERNSNNNDTINHNTTTPDADDSIVQNKQEEWWFAVLSMSFSVLAKLGSLGSTIATEKRWATLLSQYSENTHYGKVEFQDKEEEASTHEEFQDEDDTIASRSSTDGILLSQINARLRSIDLICNLCAPILVGFLLEYTKPSDTALVIAIFNLVAFPLEAGCLVWIRTRYHDAFNYDKTNSTNGEGERQSTENTHDSHDDGSTAKCDEAWKLYWRQPYFRSFLALAILYFSVVGFGSLMTAWLVASGFRPGYVGVARAIAAISGIGATFVTPRSVQRHGVEVTGLLFIWWMWACIFPSVVAAFYSTNYEFCLWIVVLGVILSRFGLWGFDLAVTQLLQECVEPSHKIGIVNGTQAALQNAFDALAALSCVLLPDPANFVYLILGSFGAVTIAALLHFY